MEASIFGSDGFFALTAERKRRIAARFPFGNRVYRAIRNIANPEARSISRLQNQKLANLLQPYPTTRDDRYPQFFTWVRDQLKDVSNPRILSFGCSTGEELFSLWRYFPQSQLTGIDINPRNIKICNQKLRKASHARDIRFVCAESPAAEPSASYDAIFCMAVLRHGELQALNPDRCDQWLDFATVESLVKELARCLKPGGYLVIWHTHFRFTDMEPSRNFEAVLRHERGGWANMPLYGPDNCKLSVEPYCDAVFRKNVTG
jgi:SAM-dependent methyltransferase